MGKLTCSTFALLLCAGLCTAEASLDSLLSPGQFGGENMYVSEYYYPGDFVLQPPEGDVRMVHRTHGGDLPGLPKAPTPGVQLTTTWLRPRCLA
jgi:hypothetical protein